MVGSLEIFQFEIGKEAIPFELELCPGHLVFPVEEFFCGGKIGGALPGGGHMGQLTGE